MRNVSKFVVPALFAGIMAASMPAMAAIHANTPARVQNVKAPNFKKKRPAKAAKAS